MSVKRGLHPLQASGAVSSGEAARLRDYSITTLEELLAALNTQRFGVAELLDLDDEGLDDLEKRVEQELPDETISRYKKPVSGEMERGFGARIEPPPD